MNDTGLMQAFFESTDAVFYIKDAEGRFLLVNRRGAQMLDLSRAECVGKTAYDVLPRAQADLVSEIDRQVSVSGIPANFKDEASLPTGQRTLLDHKFPISIPGYPGAIAGIAVDVTEVD